jgi:hypothetical protein
MSQRAGRSLVFDNHRIDPSAPRRR